MKMMRGHRLRSMARSCWTRSLLAATCPRTGLDVALARDLADKFLVDRRKEDILLAAQSAYVQVLMVLSGGRSRDAKSIKVERSICRVPDKIQMMILV